LKSTLQGPCILVAEVTELLHQTGARMLVQSSAVCDNWPARRLPRFGSVHRAAREWTPGIMVSDSAQASDFRTSTIVKSSPDSILFFNSSTVIRRGVFIAQLLKFGMVDAEFSGCAVPFGNACAATSGIGSVLQDCRFRAALRRRERHSVQLGCASWLTHLRRTPQGICSTSIGHLGPCR
jgi:hypothetical protein